MLDTVFTESLKYLEQMPKEKRKAIGQFFTSAETARHMASMFNIPQKPNLTILDPGAGSGILTAAIVDRLQHNSKVKHIMVTCYETSEDVLPILRKNLECIKVNSKIAIDYEIIEQNYITSQAQAFQAAKAANIGVIVTGGAGGGFPYFGASGFATVTSADNIYKQEGMATSVGGSLNIAGGSLGAEYQTFTDPITKECYHGGTVMVGGAASLPVESHGEVTYSVIIWSFNVRELFRGR